MPAASIDIVLPCLNEAAALPWVLARIPVGARAIVVDNGSTDGSPGVARALGAAVVNCPTRGYGAACRRGLDAASAEIVAICDCDGTLDPGLVGVFAAALDGADLVVARRRPLSRAAWPPAARLANRVLARRVSRRIGTRIDDVGPLRVARRADLLELPLQDERFGYPVETVVRAAERGWRIVQHDVPYRERIGASKVTGTARGYLTAVRDISAVLAA